MKTFQLLLLSTFSLVACQNREISQQNQETTTASPPAGGQASVVDDVSQQDIVKAAIASPDHKVLVEAVQAAGLVNALSNAGPFTV